MVKVEELEPVTASDRGVATDGVILVGNPNDDDDVESFSGVGLVTNSILFCWLFTINDHHYKKASLQGYALCSGMAAANISEFLQ